MIVVVLDDDDDDEWPRLGFIQMSCIVFFR